MEQAALNSQIAQAVEGNSIALAGLLLVFVGFLYSQASSFGPGIDEEISARFARAGQWGMLPFSVSVLLAILSHWWLLCGGQSLYHIVVWGFAANLVLVLVYGLVSIFFFMRG